MTYHFTKAFALLIGLSSMVLLAHWSFGAAAAPRQPARQSAAGAADLQTVTIQSRALGAATRVYVLLPDGYTSTRQRYPVLYLLNGNLGTYHEWADKTDVIQFARHYPVIVVMPEGGSNWFANPISGKGPRWEDYHIDELIPYIDAHYRTVASRTGRFIAGLSTGGFGAIDYAARHPDLFVYAASYSGSVDLHPLQHRATFPNLLVDFGDPVADAWDWDGHDPVDLASNLSGVQLYLACGNGQPGPYDGNRRNNDPYEVYSLKAMYTLVSALQHAGVAPAPTVVNYGNGTHTWLYFQRDLHQSLPLMLQTFAHPPAAPAAWSYRTTDDRFAVWGYQGVRTGGAHSWIQLEGVSTTGLTASGAGTLAITTAPLYRPGASYAITVGTTRQSVKADTAGRLSLSLALDGPTTPRRLTIAPA